MIKSLSFGSLQGTTDKLWPLIFQTILDLTVLIAEFVTHFIALVATRQITNDLLRKRYPATLPALAVRTTIPTDQRVTRKRVYREIRSMSHHKGIAKMQVTVCPAVDVPETSTGKDTFVAPTAALTDDDTNPPSSSHNDR